MRLVTAGLLAVVVLTGRSGAGEPAGQPLPPVPELTVVNVSSHCDWAWRHSRAWHEDRYAQIIRSVLAIMREHPGYVWQMENVSTELLPFLEQASHSIVVPAAGTLGPSTSESPRPACVPVRGGSAVVSIPAAPPQVPPGRGGTA